MELDACEKRLRAGLTESRHDDDKSLFVDVVLQHMIDINEDKMVSVYELYAFQVRTGSASRYH